MLRGHKCLAQNHRKISWGLKRMRFCLPDPSNHASSRQPFKVLYHAGIFNIRDYGRNSAGTRKVMAANALLAGPSLLNSKTSGPLLNTSLKMPQCPIPVLQLLFHLEHVLPWFTSHIRPHSSSKTCVPSRRIQLCKEEISSPWLLSSGLRQHFMSLPGKKKNCVYCKCFLLHSFCVTICKNLF